MNSFNKFNCDDNNWSSTCTDSGGANNSVTRKTLNYCEPLERRKKKKTRAKAPHTHTTHNTKKKKRKKKEHGKVSITSLLNSCSPSVTSIPASLTSLPHTQPRWQERWTLNAEQPRWQELHSHRWLNDWQCNSIQVQPTKKKKKVWKTQVKKTQWVIDINHIYMYNIYTAIQNMIFLTSGWTKGIDDLGGGGCQGGGGGEQLEGKG